MLWVICTGRSLMRLKTTSSGPKQLHHVYSWMLFGLQWAASVILSSKYGFVCRINIWELGTKTQKKWWGAESVQHEQHTGTVWFPWTQRVTRAAGSNVSSDSLFSLFTDPQSSSFCFRVRSTKAARVTRCLIHQSSPPVLAYRAVMLLLLLFMEPPGWKRRRDAFRLQEGELSVWTGGRALV